MSTQTYQPPTKDELVADINKIFPEPQTWLDTPNDQLRGKKPKDLLAANADKRQQVSDLLEAIKLGMTT